jgi:sugar phosphate isomerase/epimerase
MKRRHFLNAIAAVPVISTSGIGLKNLVQSSSRYRDGDNRLKIGLNSYSFNTPLMNGSMNLDGLLDFCAEQGFFAADLTGYYFKGYPEVPSDEYIYHVKRKAFLKGIDIGATGVRNDFTYTDESKRKDDIILVKKWIDVASKLGAAVIRIFAGSQEISGNSWDTVAKWVVKDIIECVEYGKSRGVIVALQNHYDFIKTADQALKIIKMVNSEWFGLFLDTGSFRDGDPYKEIAQTVQYAVSWQIKEDIYVNKKLEKVDLVRLFKIIKASDYRGYLALETLGEGDPLIKVPAFMKQAREALESI